MINAKNKNLICRFAVNTSFMWPRSRKVKNMPYFAYDLDKKGVDPDSIAKSTAFDINFKLGLYYEDICKSCTPQTHINNLCNECARVMKNQIMEWQQIN